MRMTDELEEFLFALEPGWFRRDDQINSMMSDGFACGDGWFFLVLKIINRAKEEQERWHSAKQAAVFENVGDWCKQMLNQYPENPWDPGRFEIVQVKSKMGSLRVYYTGGTAGFRHYVDAIEEISAHVDEHTCQLRNVLKPGSSLDPKRAGLV